MYYISVVVIHIYVCIDCWWLDWNEVSKLSPIFLIVKILFVLFDISFSRCVFACMSIRVKSIVCYSSYFSGFSIKANKKLPTTYTYTYINKNKSPKCMFIMYVMHNLRSTAPNWIIIFSKSLWLLRKALFIKQLNYNRKSYFIFVKLFFFCC